MLPTRTSCGWPHATIRPSICGVRWRFSDSSTPTPRRLPKTMALVWDSSASGARRDHGREFALLDDFTMIKPGQKLVRFGYRPGELVIRGMTFGAEPGKMTALVGPSGGGKSSLLATAAGLRRPSGESLRIFGRDLAEATEAEQVDWRRREAAVYARSSAGPLPWPTRGCRARGTAGAASRAC